MAIRSDLVPIESAEPDNNGQQHPDSESDQQIASRFVSGHKPSAKTDNDTPNQHNQAGTCQNYTGRIGLD